MFFSLYLCRGERVGDLEGALFRGCNGLVAGGRESGGPLTCVGSGLVAGGRESGGPLTCVSSGLVAVGRESGGPFSCVFSSLDAGGRESGGYEVVAETGKGWDLVRGETGLWIPQR